MGSTTVNLLGNDQPVFGILGDPITYGNISADGKTAFITFADGHVLRTTPDWAGSYWPVIAAGLARTAAEPEHVTGAADRAMLVVPRQPTDRMMNAGMYASSHDSTCEDIDAVWKSMFDSIALDGGCTEYLAADPAGSAAAALTINRFYPLPWTFHEAVGNGAAFIRDANGNSVAMMMWPGHEPDNEDRAVAATYAAGRAMAESVRHSSTAGVRVDEGGAEIERVAKAMSPIIFGGRSDEGVGPATRSEREKVRHMARAAIACLSHEGGGAVSEAGEVLSDPNAVHVNMLRGTIAKPSAKQIVHIYGRDALFAALASAEPVESAAEAGEQQNTGPAGRKLEAAAGTENSKPEVVQKTPAAMDGLAGSTPAPCASAEAGEPIRAEKWRIALEKIAGVRTVVFDGSEPTNNVEIARAALTASQNGDGCNWTAVSEQLLPTSASDGTVEATS